MYKVGQFVTFYESFEIASIEEINEEGDYPFESVFNPKQLHKFRLKDYK